MPSHERLEVFDTDTWYRGQQKLGSEFSKIVCAKNWLAIRGQTGHDLNGEFHGRGDPAAQTRQALRNLKHLLDLAGAEFSDICKIKVWVRDRAFITPVHEALAHELAGIHIVMNTVVVAAFARPWMDMEIDVYAVIESG